MSYNLRTNHQGFNPRWFFHTHFSMKGAKKQWNFSKAFLKRAH
nr:MAG TPA_asm: hypothetical protein [Caudoviricetes sp.]